MTIAQKHDLPTIFQLYMDVIEHRRNEQLLNLTVNKDIMSAVL
jgi:hypothetical protein